LIWRKEPASHARLCTKKNRRSFVRHALLIMSCAFGNVHFAMFIHRYGRKILDIESDQAVFLDLKAYPHVLAWAKKIAERPAVVRGQRVNKVWGPESEQVVERHSAADFTKTKSKEEEPAKK